MVKCVFCGRDAGFQTGVHLLKNDGSVDYYCSGKCRKNAIHLGRDKRKVMWTEAYSIKRDKSLKAENALKAVEEKKVVSK